MYFFNWIILTILVTFLSTTKSAMTEEELKQFLKNEYENNASALCTQVVEAKWAYTTDLTNKEKKDNFLNITSDVANIEKEQWRLYFKDLNPDNFHDKELKRQLKRLKILGTAALDVKKSLELRNIKTKMKTVYSTAKICPYDNQKCDLDTKGISLEPKIESLLEQSKDYDELLYIWTAWRNVTGAKIRELYKTYVKLSNEAAIANGFSDNGEMWRSRYETENFIDDIDELWAQVKPLYAKLHKYAANKLKSVYKNKLDISDGLIPAHIFGNMWAQNWMSLDKLLKPFPDAHQMNVTAALINHNYTVLKMFETSDEFYKSMGLLPNDICYNTSAGAIIEKPTDGRKIVCHASAWNFCDGKNYRVKMCTSVNFKYFETVHHEMGHIQYYLQYKNLLYNFRTGANPGFHEAIGDTIALSVTTPKHLKKIGLIQNYTESEESSINALMFMALQKIAFLPFGLLIDKWRWDVFSGVVKSGNWNAHWWEYRKKYQKIKPPVERSDSQNFDPGAKYHIPADSQYIGYFISHILQFQFYRSLCIAAGEYNPHKKDVPLHKCDFYKSTAAGDKFSAGLKLGAQKHWRDVLEVMTGERNVNASAILEYFEPLDNWLKETVSSERDFNTAETVHPISASVLTLILVLIEILR